MAGPRSVRTAQASQAPRATRLRIWRACSQERATPKTVGPLPEMLQPEQAKRLRQIQLQKQGPIALLNPTIAAELGEVVHGDPHYRVLFFIGAALFVITFFLNLAGHAYVSMLKRKLQG